MTEAWNCVTADESVNGSVECVTEILRSCFAILRPEVVVVSYVDGGGPSIARLRTEGDQIRLFEKDDLLGVLAGVVQLNWGDFFLMKSLEEARRISFDQRYAESIGLSEATIRVIDSGSIEVFTRSPALVGRIQQAYSNSRLSGGELSEFCYPE